MESWDQLYKIALGIVANILPVHVKNVLLHVIYIYAGIPVQTAYGDRSR